MEIGRDNQAAMDTLNLNEPAPGHYIVDEVWKQLKKIKLKYPATNLIVWWILGNMGVEGNKMADAKAKWAAEGNASPPHTLPTLLHSPLPITASAARSTHNEKLKNAAAMHLATSKCYPRLRSIDTSAPSPCFCKLTADLSRRKASLLVQLCTRHVPLNQHLA